MRIAAGMDKSRTSVAIEPRLPSKARNVWILLRIHLHALRQAPGPYLLATWWRFRRKRVRARAQFATLLPTSPLAYQLWLHNEKPADLQAADVPPIIALIDCAGAASENAATIQARAAATLRSLAAEGISALPIGEGEIPTLAEAAPLIAWHEKPLLMLLAAGDVLAPAAASTYRHASAVTPARILYADDDLLDAKGHRQAPHFKPQWNAELFRHHDYLTGACVVRASAQDLQQASGPDWPRRLVERIVLASEHYPPVHLPQVLHHRVWRLVPRVPVAVAGAANETLPPVTVIVPTRNRVDLLRTCLTGLERTAYPDVEVIVVDNGSDDPATLAYLDGLDPVRYRVLRRPGPFNFSTLNNQAAAQAKGDLLCLLNNDVEVLAPNWLAIMAQQAMREEVGAVGACLLYPDRRIQHAGVVLGIGGGAAHAHRLLRPDEEGYFRRHALPQFVSAVTAACLMVQRQRFEAVGGLDEANFAVAFNDVDLCMRLNARGWQSFYEPRATLVHHESVSRGLDREPVGAARFAGELAALKAAWNTGECIDPFHHPQLNRFSERFVVRL